MPFVNIDNINIIRANLGVLASFDGHRGLGGKGARKLHINTATGAFSTKDGLYQNIFQRGENDSLLNADTIRTIRTMFANAVTHMKTYAGPDKQRDETRKLLFRGVRGLAYLAYQGYRARPNYNLLQDMINSIKKDLEVPLKSILRDGRKDQYWFDTGVQIAKPLTFTQSDFLENTMGGICHGICMDWCRRVLVKNKFSFKTSSKQIELDQMMQEIRTFQHAQLNADLLQIKNNVLQDPAFTTEADKRAEFFRQAEPFSTATAEKITANEKTLRAIRYNKKSTYQALAQQNQHEKISNVSEKISMLQQYKLECESKINGTFNIAVYQGALLVNHQERISDKTKESLRKAVTLIDNAIGSLGGNFPLTRAAEKFSRMEYQETEQLYIPENNVLCMSDPSDFLNYLTPLINTCVNSMDDVTPKAFYLSFKFGGNYAGMDVSGGHALAFTKDPATNVFYAIDPNYGEYSSQTVDGLTFIFCVLLSHYSLIRNIRKIETATVSLRDVP
jgi:hypothetical protein